MGLIPAWLALPGGSRAATGGSTVDTPRESPLDPGEHGPPAPVRTLDPRNPVALELARLYDALRAANGPEIEVKRTVHEHDWAGDEIPDDDDEAWEAHCEARKLLLDDEHRVGMPRTDAYFALLHAVIEAHGGGTPWLSEYYRYGTAHRVVRVGDRVYSLCSDYDSDWPDQDDGDHGSLVLSVIDI